MDVRIGLQIYTLRDLATQDFEGVVRQAAEIGFDGIEFAGYYGAEFETVKRVMKEMGLSSFGGHVRLEDLRGDLDRVVSEHAELGSEFVLCPWMDAAERTEEEIARFMADVPRFAEALAKANIAFGYHNHDFEFNTTLPNGATIWQTLLDGTTAETMMIELDPFWAFVGGADPLEVLRRLGTRAQVLQFKDVGHTDEKKDVPAGEGRLNWDALVSLAVEQGINRFVVEQDYPNAADPVADVRTAYETAVRCLNMVGSRSRHSFG